MPAVVLKSETFIAIFDAIKVFFVCKTTMERKGIYGIYYRINYGK